MPCLDTSFLVDYLHEAPYTLEYLEANSTATYHVPTLACFELYAGAVRSDAPEESITAVAEALEWADVVDFGEPAAREAARIRADLLDRGERINAVDTLIAGVARDADAVLVATDGHFERVPRLEVHDPRDGG